MTDFLIRVFVWVFAPLFRDTLTARIHATFNFTCNYCQSVSKMVTD